MKSSNRKRVADQESQRRDESLSATDVARYFHDLARTHQGERTGNPALADALRQLSEEFRLHGERSISELAITDRFVWLPDIRPITAKNGKPTNRRRRNLPACG